MQGESKDLTKDNKCFVFGFPFADLLKQYVENDDML